MDPRPVPRAQPPLERCHRREVRLRVTAQVGVVGAGDPAQRTAALSLLAALGRLAPDLVRTYLVGTYLVGTFLVGT